MVNYSYSRELRLLTPANFSNVFKNQLRAGSPQLTILACVNEFEHPRLGLAVPKKQVKLAVDRNKIKRVLRENFRLNQHDLPAIDMVVMVKSGIDKLDNKEINQQLSKIWRKINQRHK